MTASIPAADLTVDVERKPGSCVELRVEAPVGEFDAAVAGALRRLSRRLRVPGFRPGKVPGAIVERTMGWEAVREETIDALVPVLYRKALDQAKLRPVGEPEVTVETADRAMPLLFTVKVAVRPDVDLGDYQGVRVPFEQTEVGDEQIDLTLEQIRRNHAATHEVDRPAQAGDVVRGTLVMTKDGEVMSGDAASDRAIELDRDTLLPGMVDGIIGLSAGDSRSFDLVIPPDYPRSELRGETVSIAVTVGQVQERELPPLDDALAVLDGNAETVGGMREYYTGKLTETAARRDDERYETAVLAAFRDRCEFEIPGPMIERQLDHQVNDLAFRLRPLGMTPEMYLSAANSSLEEFRANGRAEAAARVHLELVLDAVVEAEAVAIDTASIERMSHEVIGASKVTPAERRNIVEATAVDLRRRQAALRLLQIARGDAERSSV